MHVIFLKTKHTQIWWMFITLHAAFCFVFWKAFSSKHSSLNLTCILQRFDTYKGTLVLRVKRCLVAGFCVVCVIPTSLIHTSFSTSSMLWIKIAIKSMFVWNFPKQDAFQADSMMVWGQRMLVVLFWFGLFFSFHSAKSKKSSTGEELNHCFRILSDPPSYLFQDTPDPRKLNGRVMAFFLNNVMLHSRQLGID